jgi:hypothetical protein
VRTGDRGFHDNGGRRQDRRRVVVYVTSRRGRPAARPLHLDQDGARVLAGLLQDAALAVIDGTELAAELARAADQLAWS